MRDPRDDEIRRRPLPALQGIPDLTALKDAAVINAQILAQTVSAS